MSVDNKYNIANLSENALKDLAKKERAFLIKRNGFFAILFALLALVTLISIPIILFSSDSSIAPAKVYVYLIALSLVLPILSINLIRDMVITNSTFTKSAIELATVNDVVLWDRQVLIEKLADN